MNPPEAVVFDLGKVLLDFDYGIAGRSLEQHSRIPAADVRRLLDQTPLLYRYEAGELTTEEFFAVVQARSGFTGTLADFAAPFGDIFTPISPMVELHARLRARGIPTYIFSNTNEIAIGHVRRLFPFFGEFDGYVLSYEQRALKPEPRIYEIVERISARRGPALLYIDDRPENIATGAARGWRTILHESSEQTAAAVRTSGLLPNETP